MPISAKFREGGELRGYYGVFFSLEPGSLRALLSTSIRHQAVEYVEKDKTPNHDSVVLVQDDRMGFHICIVGY